jgi:hypothetical protein
MATGNHYLLDALSGAALTGAAFLLLSRTPIRGRLGWVPAGATRPAVADG